MVLSQKHPVTRALSGTISLESGESCNVETKHRCLNLSQLFTSKPSWREAKTCADSEPTSCLSVAILALHDQPVRLYKPFGNFKPTSAYFRLIVGHHYEAQAWKLATLVMVDDSLAGLVQQKVSKPWVVWPSGRVKSRGRPNPTSMLC